MWLISDGRIVDVFSDTWLFELPLARWLTLVCLEDLMGSPVCDLFHATDRRWNTDQVTRLSGGQLLEPILALADPSPKVSRCEGLGI